MGTMSDTRLVIAQAPVRRWAAPADSDVERVREHVARLRMKIRELDQRIRRVSAEPPTARS